MGGMIIAFFSLMTVLFAVMVIVQRQPMRAALSLVGLMLSLAAIYAALGVHVVAVFQILIYVGAVMVFMVYTIMLLDDRDSSYRQRFSVKAPQALAITLLIAALLWQLGRKMPRVGSSGVAGVTTFSFATFATEFMRQYWFHFELATVLLLVGVIAAWTAVREGSNG